MIRTTMESHEPVPRLELRGADEGEQHGRVQPDLTPVGRCRALHPAVSQKMGLDGRLECALRVYRHQATLLAVVTSNCPVTAAVISACLRSARRNDWPSISAQAFAISERSSMASRTIRSCAMRSGSGTTSDLTISRLIMPRVEPRVSSAKRSAPSGEESINAR